MGWGVGYSSDGEGSGSLSVLFKGLHDIWNAMEDYLPGPCMRIILLS